MNERYWICHKGKDNRHWDIAVYGLALADIMGIRDKRRVKKAAVKRTKKGGAVLECTMIFQGLSRSDTVLCSPVVIS